jgi:hypothetical protein
MRRPFFVIFQQAVHLISQDKPIAARIKPRPMNRVAQGPPQPAGSDGVTTPTGGPAGLPGSNNPMQPPPPSSSVSAASPSSVNSNTLSSAAMTASKNGYNLSRGSVSSASVAPAGTPQATPPQTQQQQQQPPQQQQQMPYIVMMSPSNPNQAVIGGQQHGMPPPPPQQAQAAGPPGHAQPGQHGHGAVQVQPAPPAMMAAASVASNMNQNNSYHYVTSSQANPQQQLPTAAAAGYNAAAVAAAAGTPQTIFYVSPNVSTFDILLLLYSYIVWYIIVKTPHSGIRRVCWLFRSPCFLHII